MKNTIQDCIEKLIILSTEIQEKQKKWLYHGISAKSFLKENCTIRIQASRRSGHSTAIRNLSYKHQGVAVIAPNWDIAKRLKDRCHPSTHFASADPRSLNRLRCVDTRFVFVDCASILSSKRLEEIQQVCLGFMTGQQPFFLVLVG